MKNFGLYVTILLVICLRLEGVVKCINDYYGIIECDEKQYKFDTKVIYGNRIFVKDKVIFLLEDDVVKMVTFNKEEVEEILDVG